MKDLPGGRKGVALSDGMGSGEEAFRDSTMVVEMLEELLEAGFPVETAVQMMNTALVTGREEVKFCTLDVCLFDLYQGSCEFVKAGARRLLLRGRKKLKKSIDDTSDRCCTEYRTGQGRAESGIGRICDHGDRWRDGCPA